MSKKCKAEKIMTKKIKEGNINSIFIKTHIYTDIQDLEELDQQDRKCPDFLSLTLAPPRFPPEEREMLMRAYCWLTYQNAVCEIKLFLSLYYHAINIMSLT